VKNEIRAASTQAEVLILVGIILRYAAPMELERFSPHYYKHGAPLEL